VNNQDFQIVLILPASQFETSNFSCEPPIGLLTLYSSLPERFKRKTVLLDSTVMNQDEILMYIKNQKPNVVGISSNTYNYSNCIATAKTAKENGAITIIGGIHVTFLKEQIAKKMLEGTRPFDFLICGPGEISFANLINAIYSNTEVSDIPNITFITDGKITSTRFHEKKSGVDIFTEPLDFSCLNLNSYSKNLNRIGVLKDVNKVASIFTQRGCQRGGESKCSFCCILTGRTTRPYSSIECDFINLIENQNVDHIRIMDADFCTSIDHIKKISEIFSKTFTEQNKPTTYTYLRADEVDEIRIKYLKSINNIGTFIGYESGSQRMLNSMKKHTTVEQNLAATEILKNAGIQITCAGLVLGAEGESKRTLQETIKFVMKIREIGNTSTLLVGPLIPLPGSNSFNKWINYLKAHDHQLYNRYINEDLFDIQELVELWNYYMTDISLVEIYKTCNSIINLIPEGIRFSQNKI